MASSIAPPDENSPGTPRRIPNNKILPHVAKLFQDLKESDPTIKISNISGLYQEYEQGPELLIGEDFSDKIRAIVDTLIKKYNEEIRAGPDAMSYELDTKYNRSLLLEAILMEATKKGERIFVFSIFLAAAVPTVFREEGLRDLGDVVTAVEEYMRRVGESLEVVWESLNGLADSLVMQMIVPVYRTAGTYTPNNLSAFQDGDGGHLPGMTNVQVSEYAEFVLAVLTRDNYTCAFTGIFDTEAETGTTFSAYRAGHIIPWGLGWDYSRYRETRNRLTWNLLDIFDANDTSRISDYLYPKLDEISNGLTLSREVHRRFTGLQMWLDFDEENETEYIFTPAGETRGIFGPGSMPFDKRVVVKKGQGFPDRRLIDLHARLSRVAWVSGAINVAKEFTGNAATTYVDHGPDHKSVHPKALELKLLSINEPENKGL
ncbi:hypothetical protein TWF225_007972 [Orbilia oligospora]|uniref:HNH nuclease domain-containing protein n=1 Tax=Orbilia oligospora TaxID=2813651 RepID=A0A7C8P6X6_ORBOL|nr:hypothetical protein TWF751_002454 [Orbilia oligospora]KAF3178214.1 hypothetical protein TWF225_007972 [Orbilia oligospora]KAF3237425.1 hypothetical protein TWF128_000888 [Orbilia oligospora]KAF3247465.1 hypothetical protein TWF217_009623 [Orbilia oligospora]TGJ70241.1 hypothetical protein EYR41_006220 [Orbilia oligospora]